MLRKLFICLSLVTISITPAVFGESKPKIGVAEFHNDTSAGWWSGTAGTDLSGMLTAPRAGGQPPLRLLRLK